MRYRQTSDKPRPPHHGRNRYREGAVEVIEELSVSTIEPVLSFTVMAHEKRKEWAEEIAAEIGCDITWDRRNDRHDTGARAIEAYNPKATHHVVVQDDALLCGDFVNTLTEACRYAHPFAPLGLYHGGKGGARSAHVVAHNHAVDAGARWLIRKGPIWGPGIVYPVATIPDLLKYFKTSAVQNYDRRVMRYYQSVEQDCWYTVPSLVDHRTEENPSLCGHDLPNRHARLFAGPQTPSVLRWNGPAVRSKA
jgi:hypothetical protein